MKKQDLSELIKTKWLDDYQNGLESRFSASGMTYNFRYEESDSINSVIVFLSKGDIKTNIKLSENGNLDFFYSHDMEEFNEEFQNCSEDDFHLMIAHAFIYIRDGSFDYHSEWYSRLEKRINKHNKT